MIVVLRESLSITSITTTFWLPHWPFISMSIELADLQIASYKWAVRLEVSGKRSPQCGDSQQFFFASSLWDPLRRPLAAKCSTCITMILSTWYYHHGSSQWCSLSMILTMLTSRSSGCQAFVWYAVGRCSPMFTAHLLIALSMIIMIPTPPVNLTFTAEFSISNKSFYLIVFVKFLTRILNKNLHSE